MGSLLEVSGLRTRFTTPVGEARAVDDVSFRVEAGEAVGVVGESGCGKTTTALSILGLLPQPEGSILPGSSIRFRGRELVGLSRGELRRIRGRRIGMTFQEPMTALNPVLRVGAQVEEALRLHGGGGSGRLRERCLHLLREVGLPDPEVQRAQYPHELSGGMRQRVLLAVALAGEPELLIADEPTTALDVTIQAQILDLLDRLRREREMSLLLITHDLGVVAESCERVLVMYAGQVVEEGPVKEVFRDPRHPYTQGLLASLPRPGSPGHLTPIGGTVPEAVQWPSGCRFADRCPLAWDRCRREAPPLLPVDVSGSRRVARCWLEDGS